MAVLDGAASVELHAPVLGVPGAGVLRAVLGMSGDNLAAWYNSGTLGDATALLSGPGWACACSGPIWWPAPPGTPCGCQANVDRAHRLHHGAHIVANLMLQVVDKLEADEARDTPLVESDPEPLGRWFGPGGYCGDAVWSWHGIDGQCFEPYGHDGKCTP